jgi:hypothetical protein
MAHDLLDAGDGPIQEEKRIDPGVGAFIAQFEGGNVPSGWFVEEHEPKQMAMPIAVSAKLPLIVGHRAGS